MPTASTKSRAGKSALPAAGRTAAAAAADRDRPVMSAAPETVSTGAWRVLSMIVMSAAALMRFAALELKPLHHDEGVNGFFLTRLIRERVYNYDPSNYHGPTLYYLSVPSAFLFGLSTFAVRFVPALFGVATVWLALLLRRRIGEFGALTAAALIALSPGAVYMSRYFIHESLFVFFTFAIIVAAVRYYDSAQPVYLMTAAAAAALLFATKETAFISAGVLALATGVAWAIARVAPSRWGDNARAGKADKGGTLRRDRDREGRPSRLWPAAGDTTLARFGGVERVILLLLGAGGLFIFINVLFYSSFFSYLKGVVGALETFKIWTRTGSTDHVKPFHTYLVWLWQEESPLLLLGVIGAGAALLRGARNRFAVFAGAWAFGLLLAYSLVPYKTPWLMLNFIVPLAISGGYAVHAIYEWGESGAAGPAGQPPPRPRRWQRPLAFYLVVAIALIVCGYQSLRLNFRHYDNDQYPYVYAHTRREFLSLVSEIERYAAQTGTGTATAIAVASPDYWPLPWYLRDYKNIGYHGRVDSYREPVVVANESQVGQLQPLLGPGYQRIGDAYPLRPGVNLVIYAKRDALRH